MELIFGVLAAASAILFVVLNILTIVQLCRRKLTIDSLVYQTSQIFVLVLIGVCYYSFGVNIYLYAMSILCFFVHIPTLWDLAKGDESSLHEEPKPDNWTYN